MEAIRIPAVEEHEVARDAGEPGTDDVLATRAASDMGPSPSCTFAIASRSSATSAREWPTTTMQLS